MAALQRPGSILKDLTKKSIRRPADAFFGLAALPDHLFLDSINKQDVSAAWYKAG
jgi:hypothetical protein